jgi:hypothetical protein
MKTKIVLTLATLLIAAPIATALIIDAPTVDESDFFRVSFHYGYAGASDFDVYPMFQHGTEGYTRIHIRTVFSGGAGAVMINFYDGGTNTPSLDSFLLPFPTTTSGVVWTYESGATGGDGLFGDYDHTYINVWENGGDFNGRLYLYNGAGSSVPDAGGMLPLLAGAVTLLGLGKRFCRWPCS